jgi:cobaltochelatase CobN
MCRNKRAINNRDQKSLTKFILPLCCLLCWLLTCPESAFAGKVKVSLVPGDTPTKVAVEAVKAIYQEYPHLEKKVEFHIYANIRPDQRAKNLTPLSESNLIFIMLMGRNLVEAVRPELEKAIRGGGKVYCLYGGSYNDEYKKMGIRLDAKMADYFIAGGRENIKNMLLYALKKDFAFDVAFNAPVRIPDLGIYDCHSQKVFTDFEQYQQAYSSYRAGRPWIGVIFYKFHLGAGQTQALHAISRSLERAGFNVLPVFGPPAAAIEKFFCRDPDPGKTGNSRQVRPQTPARVNLVIALGMKIGINPHILVPLLSRLKVPVIDAIPLRSQSRAEWEKSRVGLTIFERSFQVGNPEMAGIIQPMVVASRERRVDKGTGFEYIEEKAIPERIKRLTARVKAWVNLQEKPNKDKKIALIYYNYPPGKNNIGATTLNVLPDSLWEILTRLKSAGYDVGGPGSGGQEKEISKEQLFQDIQNYGRNIGNWAPGEVARLAQGGGKAVFSGKPQEGSGRGPVLIPLAVYQKWFNELPPSLQQFILKSWGPVEQSNIMIWRDARGQKYLVIPAVRYGNILFTPQPARGWQQDIKKVYHDVTIAPHHQYVAFYLWLKKGFKADAVAHIGTHGTHEWLPGKEVGFTREDPPEVLIQDLPNIYPYTVDDVGEGLQAKRRGMAVIIDHLTPPFDKAGLNKDLKELAALINDYGVAKEKSPSLAGGKLKEINARAKKQGLLTDLKMTEIKTEAQIEEVQDYLDEIAEKQTPFGMHTFGKSPPEKYRKTTAEAILSIEKSLTGEERTKKLADLEDRLSRSGPGEMEAFLAGLSGQYVPAAQGNDPIRNPDSLPTGKNFYAFDPTRLPSSKTYEMGAKLARELMDGYQARHGQYPDKLSFVLWATETIRHEGVMESQIMYLMGIKPKRNERGRIIGVEVIPRKELGRPRIDVTMVPSGLYRDLFPNLMVLLDQAVTLAKKQNEADNLLRDHILRTQKILREKGLALEQAERLAAVRLFTTPPGAYGPNLDKVITQSNTWDNDKQLADVYLMRMSHLYGQGFWGEKIQNPDKKTRKAEDISLTLFKSALSGTKMAVHSRAGNLIATLDTDDFFQELGGLAMTIRSLDKKTPEVYVTNMTNPVRPQQDTLEKFMGREMRSRYLNPEWVKAMMQEGYAGARFIDKVVEHLWGWQVTVPEAVDAAKWNEMYETYVLDKNGLDIKKRFKDAKNMWAYQSLVARMLETVRKGYWKPDKKVMETLSKEYAESAKEVGLACCDHTCNNPLLTDFTSAVLMSVPGLENQAQEFKQALETVKNPQAAAKASKAQASPDGKNPPADSSAKNAQAPPDGSRQKVEGYEMQEVKKSGFSAAPIPYLFILGFLIFLLLLRWGWRKKGDGKRR